MADAATQQSNPFSTGGGGPFFESRVQAAFVVAMLTGRAAPCLPAWPIIRIKLQGRYAGFNTDDCIIGVQDSDTGAEAKLLAQIKRSAAVTESDEDFTEAISAAWRDFNNPAIFREGSDAIALITGSLTATDVNNVRPLMEWARHCADADEFVSKVNTANFSSQPKKKKLAVIRALVEKANGSAVSDDLLWRFLKSFSLICYDLDTDSSVTASLLQGLISQACPHQEPQAVWSQVIAFVQSADQNAGTITADGIPKDIRSCFHTHTNRNWKSALQKLRDHGDYVLRSIRGDIAGVHIDRQDLLRQLLDLSERYSLVLVTGGRGCGKSSVVREFAEFMSANYPVFCIRSEDLNKPSLDEVLSAIGLHSSISDIAASFAVMPKRYLVIESLEKLLELEHKTAFGDLMQFIQTHPGWMVVASARDYAFQQLTFSYLQPYRVHWSPITIPEFSDADLRILSDQVPALKPLVLNPAIGKLLRNPFLAELAARVTATGTQLSVNADEEAFRTAVWRDVIAKEQDRANALPIRRKRAFIEIAVRRAKAMAYGVPESDFEPEAIFALEADHLVQREPLQGLISPAHDVLEDWALDAFIDEAFQQNSSSVPNFLQAIGLEPAMNRAFRLWLHRKLTTDGTGNAADLVITILKDGSLETYCHDEAIAAVLMGENPLQFLNTLHDSLFENCSALLKRFCFVLRVCCKAPDHDLIDELSSQDVQLSKAAESLYMRPYGGGWEAIILFLHENASSLTHDLVTHVAALLEDWATLIHIEKEFPAPGREAGLLALRLLGMIKHDYRTGNRKRIISVAMRSVAVITDELSQLLERDVIAEQEESSHRDRNYVDELLSMVLLGPVETAFLCKQVPDLIVRLAQHEWLDKNPPDNDRWSSPVGVELCFGLPEFTSGLSFFPASGIKGPFSSLLRWHPLKGLDFIIDLCNRCADSYAHSTLDTDEFFSPTRFRTEATTPTVEIPLNNGAVARQYCSERLWSGYRGTSVLPNLLECALMALENWLIYIVQRSGKCQTTEWIIDHILETSNSVMPTAIVASIAVAFPDIVGTYALPLLRAPVFYELDLIRYMKEASALNPSHLFDPYDELYRNERKVANDRPWRKEHLENLVTRLQFTDLRDEVFKILDELRANIPESGTANDENTNWRFRLHRIDSR